MTGPVSKGRAAGAAAAAHSAGSSQQAGPQQPGACEQEVQRLRQLLLDRSVQPGPPPPRPPPQRRPRPRCSEGAPRVPSTPELTSPGGSALGQHSFSSGALEVAQPYPGDFCGLSGASRDMAGQDEDAGGRSRGRCCPSEIHLCSISIPSLPSREGARKHE